MYTYFKSYFDTFFIPLESCKYYINATCEKLEPWQIIGLTFVCTLGGLYIWDFVSHCNTDWKTRVVQWFFHLAKKIPFVRAKIENKMSQIRHKMHADMDKLVDGVDYIQNLPISGLTESEVMSELMKYKQLANISWQGGKVSGTVYHGADKLTDLVSKAYTMFTWSNPLHPDVFVGVRKLEAEVVRMCCGMFNGDGNTTGSVTSGGTESILLACLAYRSLALERGIRVPEMLVPITVHAAFDKAAAFFNMRIIHIPVDEVTRKVNIKKMQRSISRRTCMLGQKYTVPVHVDICLGGFLIPFMEKAGFPIEPFDFRLHGVTSISADAHKYGYAPKGASVIMYRSVDFHRCQFFIQPDWTGGIYASPTLAGSRSGAIIAACWATMMHFGEMGYVESTRTIVSTTRFIVEELKQIEEIFVFGDPQVCVIGFGSKQFDIFRIFDMLVERKWLLNSLQFPASVHLCVTMPTCQPGVAQQLICDIKDCVRKVMLQPDVKCEGAGALYGMAQKVPDRSLVREIASTFVEMCYVTTKLPANSSSDGVSENHLCNGL